ncbi:MAG: hypothetical protein P8Y64_01825 [Gammaproteobacteria bacterium]
MALIATVPLESAQDDVAEIYRQAEKILGGVPNALSIMSVSPLLLKQQWEYIAYNASQRSFTQPLLAMIRLLVSQENNCEYCIGLNTGLLINRFGLSQEQVDALRKDPSSAPLDEREKAMLQFVLKAVGRPSEVNADDIGAMHDLGWGDGDILDAVTHGARMLASDVVFNAFKLEADY